MYGLQPTSIHQATYKTLSLNDEDEKIKKVLFSDNQPHINLKNIYEGDVVNVICSITSSLSLLQLLLLSNALDNLFTRKNELVIPYLLGARSDRVMQTGDSVDLKVIADLINYCSFKKVTLFDVHSEVSLMLIANSVNITNEKLVRSYQSPNDSKGSILICPDSGAAKKIHKCLEWNKEFEDIVYCVKHRDMGNGNISLKVLEPEKCKDRNCVIVDDLCDGGRTFISIAEQIKPKYLTLIVSHGIFSYGFSLLEKHFNKIITSDSYNHNYESDIVEVVKLIDYETVF